MKVADRFAVNRAQPPRRIVYEDDERKLTLRPWAFEDTEALIAAVAASAKELRAYMPWAHEPPLRETQYQVIRRFADGYWAGREYVFGMFDAGGSVLGGLGLHPRTALNPRALEVGYWCATAHSKRGWVTTGVQVLAVLAFDWFECDRLQVMYDETNAASQRVVEKCGFLYEGTLVNTMVAATPELRAGGYRGTSRHRLHALTPEIFRELPWAARVRARTVVEDALGGDHVAKDRS